MKRNNNSRILTTRMIFDDLNTNKYCLLIFCFKLFNIFFKKKFMHLFNIF
jgi:hypothetical protein